MRAIFLIGINFVRTQWIALAVMFVYVTGISGVYRLHTQREDLLFFLRWHAGYAIFLAIMMAVPALQTERKTRRILAVLSKGIYRWEYLGGILCGCTIISAIFCLLIGSTAAWLGQQGGIATDGLAAITLAIFCCCMAAAAMALFFATFLHPLPAMGAASVILFLPFLLDRTGSHPWAFFPVASLIHTLWTTFQFRPVSGLPTLILMAIFQALACWIAASVIFARRDVTISPE
ncbi:MAG TPA: hypothetical protein VKU42_13905 [Candidatus Angelobacter sp.]|nr:hypothetical protein [Candidatus Angelobacter sp.]